MAIALSEAAQTALLAWVLISPRLASARLTATTAYAPKLDAAEDAKDSFYNDLQDTVDRVPAGDILIDAGDWNTRPDPVDMATRHILRKIALGTRCANSDRLVNFTSANRLVVSALASNTHNATLSPGTKSTTC